MRFLLCFLGTEILDFEFTWPSRGIYPVPDYIPSELEVTEFNYNDELGTQDPDE